MCVFEFATCKALRVALCHLILEEIHLPFRGRARLGGHAQDLGCDFGPVHAAAEQGPVCVATDQLLRLDFEFTVAGGTKSIDVALQYHDNSLW